MFSTEVAGKHVGVWFIMSISHCLPPYFPHFSLPQCICPQQKGTLQMSILQRALLCWFLLAAINRF